jgi:hypothetical protein
MKKIVFILVLVSVLPVYANALCVEPLPDASVDTVQNGQKLSEKAIKKQQKQQEKEAKELLKQQEKEAKESLKQQEKEAKELLKQQEKDAKESLKQQEKEAKQQLKQQKKQEKEDKKLQKRQEKEAGKTVQPPIQTPVQPKKDEGNSVKEYQTVPKQQQQKSKESQQQKANAPEYGANEQPPVRQQQKSKDSGLSTFQIVLIIIGLIAIGIVGYGLDHRCSQCKKWFAMVDRNKELVSVFPSHKSENGKYVRIEILYYRIHRQCSSCGYKDTKEKREEKRVN